MFFVNFFFLISLTLQQQRYLTLLLLGPLVLLEGRQRRRARETCLGVELGPHASTNN